MKIEHNFLILFKFESIENKEFMINLIRSLALKPILKLKLNNNG